MMNKNCPLCIPESEDLIWSNERLRVILVNEAEYPGFCRIIWSEHIAEMTDLHIEDRSLMMRTVMKVEQAIIDVMHPDKVNLASLGNMVPHLHWHVIPRYRKDIAFPGSFWSAPQRESDSKHLAEQLAKLPELKQCIKNILSIN